MADRNPLLVHPGRANLFKRLFGKDSHGDPAELQRVQAELERSARIGALRQRLNAKRKPLGKLEAFYSHVPGEPGSRPKLTGVALRKAHRRSERHHYGRRHGRTYRVAR
jgi:hypothetical protein